ncbi:MAG TPA: tetratricopeptide repeat protein [Candidatus Acidoferrum sp.]|nr:tetratricopeptide repeat protein [Candidatus Acidoferrum sp.]
MSVKSSGVGVCAVTLFAVSLCAQSSGLAEKSHHAKDLMAAQRFEEAIPIYRELVQALPNNPGIVANLGLALEYSGHKREALAEFERVLKLEPGNGLALFFLGTTYLDLGEAARALPPLEKLSKIDPENREAQEALAEARLTLHRFAPAAEGFEKLSRDDSGKPKVWYGLGLAYDGLAQKSFDKLANLAPGSAYWLDLVAESRLDTQQLFSAFYLYRQAQEEMPALRGAHAAVAEIYRKTGHEDWAAVEDERERQLPPPNCAQEELACDFQSGKYHELIAAAERQTTPEAWFWLTHAYNQLARDAYEHLAKLSSSAPVEEVMAKIEFKRRQYVEAAKHWERALQFSPADSYVKEQLAISVLETADLVRARELFQELLQSRPESAQLNYYLGDILLKSQKPAEALPFLSKAVNHDPALLPAHASLARTYLALGQPDKAIPHLKAALSVDEDGSLHYELGRAYQAHGQLALARQMLKQYQEIHSKQEAEKQSLNQEMQITAP